MPKRNPKHTRGATRYYRRVKERQLQEGQYKDRTPYYFALLFIGIIVAVVGVVIALNADYSGVPKTRDGDIVWIDYTGRKNNGEVFDSGTLDNIEIGNNNLLEYFDQEIHGLEPGERYSFTIPAEFGYTDPGKELYGEDLNFDVRITKLIRDGNQLYPDV